MGTDSFPVDEGAGEAGTLCPETHLRALRELSRDATLSQRDLAGRLGLSLGAVNYVVNSLIDKGLLKARRFKNSRHKLAYRYVLTPNGLREKVRITRRFLQVKVEEYERLQREIEELRREAAAAESVEAAAEAAAVEAADGIEAPAAGAARADAAAETARGEGSATHE